MPVEHAGKRGDWYTVKGTDSKGRPVSVDIPAPYIDGRSEKDGRKVMERAVERMGNAPQ